MAPAIGPDVSKLACPHLLRVDERGPALIGSRCKHCGEVYFAAGKSCTRCCATEMEACDLGSRGRLWSWTVQDFLPKAPYNSGETEADFRPYGVGYVEMASGIKVESRLTVAEPARLAIGMEMALTLEAYGRGADGAPLYTYAFRPLLAGEADNG